MKLNRWLRRGIKCLLWTVGIVVVVAAIVVGVAVAYLKPERLTPIVERAANEYLHAHVNLERVELTFWSTFPRVEVDVRGLQVINHKWRDRHPGLPEWGDSLLSLRSFHGSINIMPLLAQRIELYDITIDSPKLNLVQIDASHSNYAIFPPSKDEEPAKIPDFSFGTFKIIGDLPVRFYSVADGADVSVTLSHTEVTGTNAPTYAFHIDGLTSAQIGGIDISRLRVGMGGEVRWNHEHPLKLELEDFKLGVGEVDITTSLALNMEDDLTVESFMLDLPTTPVNDIVALIPRQFRGELAQIATNANVSSTITLTHPYRPGLLLMPSVDVTLDVPAGARLAYQNLRLDDIGMALNASINGANLNASTLQLTRFNARGQGVDVKLNGTLSSPLSDPRVKGHFEGSVNLARLPHKLMAKIPAKITGTLTADSEFDLRKSYLAPRLMHRIHMTGQARLRDLQVSAPMFEAGLLIRDMELKLGTTGSYHNDKVNVDSLFTASLTIDTIAFHALGMSLNGAGLSFGLGALNTATSTDTTVINPIGGRIVARHLVMETPSDSTRIRLRDITIGGALRRYMGNARKPLLDLHLTAGRAVYHTPLTRLSLKGAEASLKLHPGLQRIGKKTRTRMDSVAALHPDWPDEQLLAEVRRLRSLTASVDSTGTGQEYIDFQVEGGMKKLLRDWEIQGHVMADRGRLFTPYFPVRNTLTGLDMEFNTDSVRIHDTRLKSGHSDFLVNGTISNIERALTSRRHRPLQVEFDVRSDTIDVNQLAAAAFAGSAFAQKGQQSFTNSELDSDLDAAIDSAAPIDSAAAFLVPLNIDARLNLHAANVLYSDFLFHDMSGTMMVLDGQINLHQLTASTEVGSADLSALYTGRDRHDLSFAFGMRLHDFRIDRVARMVPALDTIMPLLRDISGIINADIAATTSLDSIMDIDIPTLTAAIKLSGDSLVVMSPELFKTVSKWLMFKDKKRNMIDHMSVEMTMQDGTLQLYPFMFNIDRYRLGVMGHNDLNLNFKYHVAVLKSPIPFKFGINVQGNPDKWKVRLGGAKFNEKSPATAIAIADSTRINLVNQIENVFRRGVRRAGVNPLKLGTAPIDTHDDGSDTISSQDSLYLKSQGMM